MKSSLPTGWRDRLERARLYAILDTGYVAAGHEIEIARQLVVAGVDLIQLRAKSWSAEKIIALGRELRGIIPADGPLLILNDHPDLVEQTGADGVHVGQDDVSVETARAGRAILVGKSTHSLEQAVAAEREGADYIGVGPIFATPTKPDYLPVGTALIGPVRAAARVPQFCIGGINEATLPEVVAAGAQRVVIVSALLQAEDIAGYVKRVREALDAGESLTRRSL